MSKLLERVRHLPSHSIVLYLTFFKDIEERQFINSIDVLPKITAASNSPVFGISDTYLGRGIVGGHVVSFEEQGKIAARDVIEILGGKPPRDIPIVHAPSIYLFDWRELQRWKLDESKLPVGSTVLFRKPSVWQQNKRTLLSGLLIIVSLGLLVIYLLFERKQLKRARKAQEQLSGLLINAQEQERSRLAAEIHDDFSQRLAVLSLGLETVAEQISESYAGNQPANAGAHGIRQRAWCRSAHSVAPAAFFYTGTAWPCCGSGIILQGIQRSTWNTGSILSPQRAAVRVSGDCIVFVSYRPGRTPECAETQWGRSCRSEVGNAGWRSFTCPSPMTVKASI